MNDEDNNPILKSVAKSSFMKSVYYSSGVLLEDKHKEKSFITQKDQCTMTNQRQFKPRQNNKTIKNTFEELSQLWGIYPRAVRFSLPRVVFKSSDSSQIKRNSSEVKLKIHKDINTKPISCINKNKTLQRQNSSLLPRQHEKKKLLFRPLSTLPKYKATSKPKKDKELPNEDISLNEITTDDKDKQLINEEDFKRCHDLNNLDINSNKILSIPPNPLRVSSSVKCKSSSLDKQEEILHKNSSYNQYSYPIQSIKEHKSNELKPYNDQYNKKGYSISQESKHLINRKNLIRFSINQTSVLNNQLGLISDFDQCNSNCVTIFDNITLKSAIDTLLKPKHLKSRSSSNYNGRSTTLGTKAIVTSNTLFNFSINHKVNHKDSKAKETAIDIILINPLQWRKHEEIWSNTQILSKKTSQLEKYLIPPNYNDILISAYLILYPERIARDNAATESTNSLSSTSHQKQKMKVVQFTIDDSIDNPNLEILRWKKAMARVLLRWNSDKGIEIVNELLRVKRRGKNVDLIKMTQIILLKANKLYKKISGVLMTLLQSRIICESTAHNAIKDP